MMRRLEDSHWRGFRRNEFPTESWLATEAGLLALPAKEPVDLITRERFGDFVFSFEWCLPSGGNSGILYRVSEATEQSWQSGPEMQLVDDRGHPDGRYPRKTCGALYELMPPSRPISPPAGAFHNGRIVVRGFTVEHWIGETCVLECDLTSAGLRDRIAASKFAPFSLFAASAEGHIALQHHGPGAVFRRLQIEV